MTSETPKPCPKCGRRRVGRCPCELAPPDWPAVIQTRRYDDGTVIDWVRRPDGFIGCEIRHRKTP